MNRPHPLPWRVELEEYDERMVAALNAEGER